MILTKQKATRIVLVLMAVGFVLYIPKIMLRNNIYYLSIDINRLEREYLALKEEKRFLAQQLEDIKFKNQIIDSIIMREFEHSNKSQLEQNLTHATPAHSTQTTDETHTTQEKEDQ